MKTWHGMDVGDADADGEPAKRGRAPGPGAMTNSAECFQGSRTPPIPAGQARRGAYGWPRHAHGRKRLNWSNDTPKVLVAPGLVLRGHAGEPNAIPSCPEELGPGHIILKGWRLQCSRSRFVQRGPKVNRDRAKATHL